MIKTYGNKASQFLFSLIVITGSTFPIFATIDATPEPFRGQDNDSTIKINYADYTELLKFSVLEMGRSNRAKAPKSTARIGSRIRSKRHAYTAMEGNRFLFKNFQNNENKQFVTAIRKSLQLVPNEVPMSLLNAREQLAYWLNLYNISLIEQLIDIYPKKNIEGSLYETAGIMDNKFIKVSGITLSLNDIHQNIISTKFKANPIVMYGLFQGTIGGPDIRTSAYTGELVIKQLRQNANNFINSNRGTFKGEKSTFRVSSFYERNRQFFSDFEGELKTHLTYYLDKNYVQHLHSSDKFKTDVKDMSIADLTGGQRKFSSSAATNPAGLLGALGGQTLHESGNSGEAAIGNIGFLMSNLAEQSVNFSRFSPDTMKMLVKMKAKNNQN